MFYDQQSVQLKVGQTSGYKVINIPFEASYVAVQNNSTQATIAVASGQLSEQPPGATVINPTKSYTGQMTAGRAITLFWTSSTPIDANGQNEVIVSASDQPIHLQVSDNGVVVIEGTVTATFAPGQSVAIDGQPTVQFAAGQIVDVGTVNETVTVQGDTNAAITNTFVPANTLVDFGTYTVDVANLASGAQVGINGILTPEQWGYFDGVFALWSSANNYSYDGLSAYGWNDFGNAGAAIVTNNVTPVNQHIAYFDSPQAFSRIGLNLTNGETSTIVSDTLSIQIFAVRASETVNNADTNPVQQQSAQTMASSSNNEFVNTDGSQGTSPGTAFGVTPTGTSYITQFGMYYRNTGSVTQNILISTTGGLNIFQDNVPAGAVLDFKWDYDYGAALSGLNCTYSQANCGIINFWSNGIAYPQQHVPSTVK